MGSYFLIAQKRSVLAATPLFASPPRHILASLRRAESQAWGPDGRTSLANTSIIETVDQDGVLDRSHFSTDPWLHIIQGTVRAVAQVGQTWYLNFGADWRDDFTIRLDDDAAAAWEKQNDLSLTALEGQPIEVRGWLRDSNGPLVDVSDPIMLRLLPTPIAPHALPSPLAVSPNVQAKHQDGSL